MSIVQNIIFVVLLILIFVFNLTFANDIPESETLFNLGETPFINEGKVAVYFSYSINQGPPSLIIDEWQLPDDSKNILFNEYKAGFSIGERFSFVYKKINGNKLEFNSSHIGIKTTPTINCFGLKYKIYKDENYYPDYTIGINSIDLPSIDFMVGSMRERFKYYAYVAIGFFYYIPFPNKYAAGISYEFVNDFNLFFEFQTVGDSDDQFNAILFGLSYNAFQYMSIHGSLFYFYFNFKNSIPFRDSSAHPTYLITVPKKDKYFLISLRMSFVIDDKLIGW